MTVTAGESSSKLRERAEARFQRDASPVPEQLASMERQQLLHELRLRQIEQEILNEDLQRALTDLETLETRYSDIYDTALDGALLSAPDGSILAANPAACRMFERSEDEIIQIGRSGIMDTSDPRLAVALEERRREGQVTAELTCVRKSGAKFPVEIASSIFRDKNGNARTSMVIRDVTKRKQMESIMLARLRLLQFAASNSLEELLRATLDEVEELTGSKAGFYHFMEPDQITLSLQAWSTNTSTQMCRVEGSDRHYPVDQAGVWVDCVRLRRAVIHNDYASLAHRKGLPPGHAPVVRELVVPILRDGKIVALLGVGNKPTDYNEQDIETVTTLAELAWDIVERKRAEIELRKLARAVEQSPVTIMITDTQGTIEFINPKFTEVTGYNAEEAVGRNVDILKTDQTKPDTVEKMWATITEGKTWEGEFVNKRKDGSLFYEHATISALHDDNGAITHFLAVKEDISQKKSLMEQLIHAQKMESIGELAGGLAHDLNNILSVVNGYVTLAQLGMDRDRKEFSYLNEIMAASLRAASLTGSLLAYSRKQAMNRQNRDLNSLIETIGAFIRRIIPTNIEFTVSLSAEPLPVHVDSLQIEQVLLNLATNARDAMPTGGTLSIETAFGGIEGSHISGDMHDTAGCYAIVSVRDSGHGMDEQTVRRVFDPFFTTKEVGKGTGLGLSMVMGIVKQHGGCIDLQSETGSGSVFRLFLPLVSTGEAVTVPDTTGVSLEKASGTIMIAEDDATTREVMENFLTTAGYTVIAAVDGQDAVEKFAARPDEIKLVISDVVMPRKSGKTACDEIRRMSETIKIIFVSGHVQSVVESEGKLLDDAEIVMKPILPFELLQKIRKILQP